MPRMGIRSASVIPSVVVGLAGPHEVVVDDDGENETVEYASTNRATATRTHPNGLLCSGGGANAAAAAAATGGDGGDENTNKTSCRIGSAGRSCCSASSGCSNKPTVSHSIFLPSIIFTCLIGKSDCELTTTNEGDRRANE